MADTDALPQGAAEILGALIGRYESEAAVLDELGSLDETERRETIARIGAELGASQDDIHRATAAVEDRLVASAMDPAMAARRNAAQAIAEALKEWVVDPNVEFGDDVLEDQSALGETIIRGASSFGSWFADRVRSNPTTVGVNAAVYGTGTGRTRGDVGDKGSETLDELGISDREVRRRQAQRDDFAQLREELADKSARSAARGGMPPQLAQEIADRASGRDRLRETLQQGGQPIGGNIFPMPINRERQVSEQYGRGAMSVDAAFRGMNSEARPTERFALYMEGDEFQPAGWSEQRISQMQRQLIQSGLLTTTFRRGYWDGATADAYATLLATANRTGETWQAALPTVQRAYEQGVEIERTRALSEFRANLPAYAPEDPAALRVLIRERVRSRVGRAPSAAEMATFTTELARYYTEQYDAEVSDARAQMEQAVSQDPREDLLAYADTGEIPAADSADAPTPTAPAVNPDARIQEFLEAKLAGEMDLQRRQDVAQANQQTVSQIAGGLLSKVRG